MNPYRFFSGENIFRRGSRGCGERTKYSQNQKDEQPNIPVGGVSELQTRHRRILHVSAIFLDWKKKKRIFLFAFILRSRAARDPPPIAAVDTISPLPSPADPLPRALKRITEQDLPTTSRNLRRKRVMDTVFTKPVTRRRKM